MDYEISDVEKSRCLECGEEIDYGRLNKKFCCSRCKNNFNNRRVQHSRAVKARVQNALEKNYTILDRLIKKGITSLSLAELKDYGFNMDYFTSYSKIHRHDAFSCFDIRFVVMSSSVISIRRPSDDLGQDTKL